MSELVQVGPFLVGQRGPKRTDAVTAPTARQVRRVKRALEAIDDDVNVRALLPQDVTVLFGWVDFIPGTKERAAGYAVGPQRMLVRHGLDDAPNLSAEATMYVILHEGPFGHLSLAQVRPDDAWQSAALDLLDAGVPLPPYSDPDEVWRQALGDAELAKVVGTIPYWLRPYECIIDDAVAAGCDGLQAGWSRKYRRRVTDLAALKALWVGPRRATPAPLPPPFVEPPSVPDDDMPSDTPLPSPPDSNVDLKVAIATAYNALATVYPFEPQEGQS